MISFGGVIYSKERWPGISGDSERTQVCIYIHRTPRIGTKVFTLSYQHLQDYRKYSKGEQRYTSTVATTHAFCLHLYLSDVLFHLTWRLCIEMKEICRPESGKSLSDGRDDQAKSIFRSLEL